MFKLLHNAIGRLADRQIRGRSAEDRGEDFNVICKEQGRIEQEGILTKQWLEI